LRGVGTPPFFSDSIRHKAFSLTATDGTLSATPKSVLVTHVGVKLPTHLRPTRKARWRAYGFIPRRRVYLFVRRHGHTLGRFSLGKAKGACGDVSKRMRGMPLRHYTTGHYQFWFAQSKRYSKRTRIVGYDITIFRTFA
jgi:hypothetical protein